MLGAFIRVLYIVSVTFAICDATSTVSTSTTVTLTSTSIPPRVCPFVPSTAPTPTQAELEFVELGVYFYGLGCTFNETANAILMREFPSIVCPERVYMPYLPYESIYPASCFPFNLAQPQYSYGIACAGLVLFIVEFGFFFLVMVPRRHLQPIKNRDLILTFITFATSFANSVIPFGVIVYGLDFPVGFFIWASYISAPLTTGSLAFRCYRYWFTYKIVTLAMMNADKENANRQKLRDEPAQWPAFDREDRSTYKYALLRLGRRIFPVKPDTTQHQIQVERVKWLKWKWTIRSWTFILWMVPYFTWSMAMLAENYELYPQNFQKDPSVFATARTTWWTTGGQAQVKSLWDNGFNATTLLAPSVYNPNGYIPFSPHFADIIVYPSDPFMNNLSTGYLGAHCLVLFILAFLLVGKPDKLFIRGELTFMIFDIVTVVVLIIWSGWSTYWSNEFDPRGFNLLNLFYIFNALIPWMGAVLMPTTFTYTQTFNRARNAGLAKLFKNNRDESTGHGSTNSNSHNRKRRRTIKQSIKQSFKEWVYGYFGWEVLQDVVPDSVNSKIQSNYESKQGHHPDSIVHSDIASMGPQITATVTPKLIPKMASLPLLTQAKHLQVIAKPYLKDTRCWSKFKARFKALFYTPKTVAKDLQGNLVTLELINLEPATLLDTEISTDLARDMAIKMLVPESVLALIAFKQYEQQWVQDKILPTGQKVNYTAEEKLACAQAIQGDFLTAGAELEINISDKLRNPVIKLIEDADKLQKTIVKSSRHVVAISPSIKAIDENKSEEKEKEKANVANDTKVDIIDKTILTMKQEQDVLIPEKPLRPLQRNLFDPIVSEMYLLIQPFVDRMRSDKGYLQPLTESIYARQKQEQEHEILKQQLDLVEVVTVPSEAI